MFKIKKKILKIFTDREKTKRCRKILKDINNFEESEKVLLRTRICIAC